MAFVFRQHLYEANEMSLDCKEYLGFILRAVYYGDELRTELEVSRLLDDLVGITVELRMEMKFERP